MGARRALSVGLLTVVAVTAGCGSATPDASREGTTTIRSEALSLELPPGWHGDAQVPHIPQAPLLRAATFPLDEPPTDLGQQARGAMGESDLLLTVVDYGQMPRSEDPPTPLPIAVDGSHVVSFEGFREPVVMRGASVSGHRLQLWVVSRSPELSQEQFREVNRVLATLEVRPPTLSLGDLSVELLESWDGFARDIGPPHEVVPAVYLANVPWPDRGQNLAESVSLEPFERLPPGGIVIAASASPTTGEAGRLLRRPVRLADGYFLADGYEGQPARDVSTQIIAGQLGGRALHVQVYFGRVDPTDVMRAETNHVLATLHVG